jgi:hypothetical protein
MNIRINVGWLLSIFAGLTACVTEENYASDVFDNPEYYLGKKVVICGRRFDSNNLVQFEKGKTPDRMKGLTILDRGPLEPWEWSHTCLEGEISYVGCRTDEDIICQGGSYDYGISIYKVVK